MWLIALEAFAALMVLVLIVWWTMFSGRSDTDRSPNDPPPSSDRQPASAETDRQQ